MPLTETESAIVDSVVHQFLENKEVSLRKPLIVKYRDPEALERLVRWSILRCENNRDKYTPMALAFHYTSDRRVEEFASRSLVTVLRALQHMYETESEKTTFARADVESCAAKLLGELPQDTIWLGLYLAQELAMFSGWSGNAIWTEVASLQISERIVTIGNLGEAWKDHVHRNVRWIEEQQKPATALPMLDVQEQLQTSSLLILISHSSKDESLASVLIELLRASLGLLPHQIRCSSVDGYRLPAGVTTDVQLKSEVSEAKVVIGLMTPNSLLSPYVLFELGARWGSGAPMVPILAGVHADELRGPLAGLNALSCGKEAQLHQLVEDLSKRLNVPLRSPAGYFQYVYRVMKLAGKFARKTPSGVQQQEALALGKPRRTKKLVATFRGNSGRFNFVGPSSQLGPGGDLDWQITVVGLDRKEIKEIEVRSSHGGVWSSWPRPGHEYYLVAFCSEEQFRNDINTPKLSNIGGKAELSYPSMELFLEPWEPSPNLTFTIEIHYADGSAQICQTS